MENTLFDLYDLVFKYKGSNIMIIIDGNTNPWFSGIDIARILKYENTNSAIINNVEAKNKKQFSDLKHYAKDIPIGYHPHTIYINEAGFYSLIMNSRKEVAKKFKQWVLNTVLPSIREFGNYQVEQKYMDKIDNLNKKLKEEMHKNKTLENNQKQQKFPNGGLVYGLEPMGLPEREDGNKMIRLGKSEKMKSRWSTYNTAVPDNFKLLYYVEVENPIAVEYCVRSMLNKYQYRSGKDYYICNLSDFIEILDGCKTLVANGKFPFGCNKCNVDIRNLKEYVNHYHDKHNLNIHSLNKQLGGNNEINENIQYNKNIEYNKIFSLYKNENKYVELFFGD